MAVLSLDTVVFLYDGKAIKASDLKIGSKFVHEESSFQVMAVGALLQECSINDRILHEGKWYMVLNEQGQVPILALLEDYTMPFSDRGILLAYIDPTEHVVVLRIVETPLEKTSSVNVVTLKRR
jgi:hypothetical protein